MATDQEIRDAGLKYVPKQKYLQNPYELPVAPVPPPVSEGIVNTNAFANSGGDNFNSAGNAFGYGSQIEPGSSYGSYDSINYTGGLPGNVQQYGIGRQFEDPSASPTGETYSYRKKVPKLLRAGAAFVPFGNTLLNFAEKKMNANRDEPSGTYRIGGLDESMKGYYDNLAGSGMLFDGPNGIKTLTGKNFTGKGYLEGQLDIYNDKFAGMTEEEIEELKNDPRKQFKYKQYLEASQMYKTNKAQKEKTSIALDKKLAAENEAAANRGRVEAYTDQPMSDYRQSRPRSEQNYTGGDTNSNPSTQGAQDSFSNKSGMGRTGYFFGGRVNYKAGGRTDAGPNRTTASKAGVGQINESGQKVSGGNFNNNNNDGGNDNPSNFFVEDKTSIVDTSGLKSKSPEINIDYTDPRNYASLKSRIYNENILDNDNINVDGTLSGEIGPVNYGVDFTNQGITGTNLTAGNFTTNLNPDMQVQDIGYANNYNGIDYGVKYDNNGNLMFNAGVNFKNGGLAGLL
jgi:hypothetical protein